jgi:hypothetical protein
MKDDLNNVEKSWNDLGSVNSTQGETIHTATLSNINSKTEFTLRLTTG